MYIALETIILTDVFGKENQYLKGHEYSLTYSDWGIEKNPQGRSVTAYYSNYLHSEEDKNKYFKYKQMSIIHGGRGHKVFCS